MIFLVDDDLDLLTSFKKRLELRGYPTLATHDAKIAEEQMALHAAKIQIVLSDYSMKNSAGTDLIWKSLLGYGPAVYLMTGHGKGFADDEEIQRLGVAKILHKPIDIHELIEDFKQFGITKNPA